MVMTDGTVYRLITDHLGSVRLVVNAETGQVVQRMDYDAFGRVLNDTAPGFQPFGFAGGVCDDGTEPVPGAQPIPEDNPTLWVGLTGSASESASVEMIVTPLDALCGEPLDGDLTGVWVAESRAVQAAFQQVYEPIGTDVTGVGGELELTIRSDGTLRIEYDAVTLLLSDPVIPEVVLDGYGEMKWRNEGGKLIAFGLTDLDLRQTIPGLGEPIRFTEDDLPGGGETTADYTVEGRSLALDNVMGSLTEGVTGGLVFPARWTRIGDVP